MNLKNIRDLDIAKNQFNYSKDIKDSLVYGKWVDYILNSNSFIWFEDTKNGKDILNNIENIPDDFRQSFLSLFDHTRCYIDYNSKKDIYDIAITFHEELKRIRITFERKVKINDLKLFLDMANYLDAYLLYNGKTIIDEKVIESLK